MTFRDWGGGGSFWTWTPGQGSDGHSERRAAGPRFPLSRKTLILLVLLLLLTLGLPALASFLADYYWFQAEGFSSVFWTRLIPQWVLLAVFSVLAFGIIGPNFALAFRRAKAQQDLPMDAELYRLLHHRFSFWLLLALAVFFSLSSGAQSMDQWQMVLQFVHGQPFGVRDPVFGKDVGFYVFSLPFWTFLQKWLFGVIFSALVGVCAIYGLTLSASFRGGLIQIPQAFRSHGLTLGSALAACWGLSYWLQRYLLLYSPQGVSFGAGYTDVHVNLTALIALTALSWAVAALLLWATRSNRSWRFIALVAGAFVAVNVLLRGVLPGLVQQYLVTPNEFEKERPYIEHNIAATLKAYGLDDLSVSEMVPDDGLSREDVLSDGETLDNVRLWDYRALLRSYKQLQEIRSYYELSSVDIDRYFIDGKIRQVMVAPRELDITGLQNRTWVNQHLEFTHGYGLVMNPAGEVGLNGQPLFWLRDLPPVSSVPLTVDRPQIYFGEMPSHYVFVKTTVKEFDYPIGESNARSSYEGDGGVPMGSLWRQLVYSLAFGDAKILFTSVFTPESRVMYRRNILERLEETAPFLLYDNDPYIALVDNRMVWIVDAYTVSDAYPYAEPVVINQSRYRQRPIRRSINYIRNSVKATVDAYDGSMKFYITDPEDPLIRTWQAIFPDLFLPASAITPGLDAHTRYPRDLFSIQAEIYRTYHMQDPNTFYNKEDVWNTLKGSEVAGALDSYYVVMKLAGQEHPEFILMTPYTPMSRDNMIAWLAARSDGDGYGKLVVYQFPKQTLIYGPNQVSALINQTPEISAQLSLWTQRGSDVIRGHLLVIPVGNSLLYVQPLYLKAETSDLPELKRVILSSGGRVVWGETFEDALERLLSGTISFEGTLEIPETAAVLGGSQAAPQPLAPMGGDLQSLAQQAQAVWNRSQQALRALDWAAYGQAMGELEALLNRMVTFP